MEARLNVFLNGTASSMLTSAVLGRLRTKWSERFGCGMRLFSVAVFVLLVGFAHGLIEGLYCGSKSCYDGKNRIVVITVYWTVVESHSVASAQKILVYTCTVWQV